MIILQRIANLQYTGAKWRYWLPGDRRDITMWPHEGNLEKLEGAEGRFLGLTSQINKSAKQTVALRFREASQDWAIVKGRTHERRGIRKK